MAKPGRPLGSKNKPKVPNLVTFNLEKQIPNAPETKINPLGWINWGLRNDFPEFLTSLYYTSTTHKACVDFITTAICGEQIITDSLMPNYGESWDSFINKLALDLVLFGGYSFQVIMNKDGKTYSFYHQPFNTVRCGTPNDEDIIDNMWICKDWTNTSQYKPFNLPRFGFNEDEVIKKGQAYIFWYKRYTVDSEWYPLPHYYSAVKAIQTEGELVRYDLKSVINNFSANGVIALDRIDDDNQRKQVIDNIQKMFQGSENSNTVMITFKNNSEDNPITFTPFDKDISNVNLFSDNNERTISRILSSHKIANAALIGLYNQGTGFNSEAQFLEASYNLLNKTLVKNLQKEIVTTINKMFKINGVDNEVIIKPLSFNLQELSETKVEVEEYTNEEYTNDNIEDKVTE